jgi:hypothetical protein
MAASGATALVTADVATNSADYDNGFFQHGLPAKLDANSDDEITWTEWIVGFTASSDAWALFKMNLGDSYSITTDVWIHSVNEAIIRDLNGDDIISWSEFWVSNKVFSDYNSWTVNGNADGTETVPLQTFIDAGASADLQALYDFNNDTIVTMSEYQRTQAVIASFNILTRELGVETLPIASIHEYGLMRSEFTLYDTD